jgi:CO dehydrogenase/acetyl-CoA synthase gamma subunit (corrinoid Fe-S protein)
MVASANLYIEEVNFLKYLNQSDCAQCGIASCEEFVDAAKKGIKKPQDCPFLSTNEAYAFETARNVENLWPEVPLLTHPRPSFTGLVELHWPGQESLVLLLGNNEYTEEVLMTVLGTTIAPFFVIFVDTDGNTVDMAMIYKTLTVERVLKAVKETGIERKVRLRELVIPGFAAPLREDIERSTGWNVRVGPICAAELPLFFSEIWAPPEPQKESGKTH